MHEREEHEDDDERPVFMAGFSEFDDAGLRRAWMDAGECIAAAEKRIALWLRQPLSCSSSLRSGDHIEPGFIYLGERESLAFIAAMAAGILRYGPAFSFWVRKMGQRPEAPEEFEKVFLGHWQSAAEFAQHVLDQRDGSDEPERRDEEEPREEAEIDATIWAQDLQRRGEINVVPSPEGGVWVFRGW
jgi:hypothetical protein